MRLTKFEGHVCRSALASLGSESGREQRRSPRRDGAAWLPLFAACTEHPARRNVRASDCMRITPRDGWRRTNPLSQSGDHESLPVALPILVHFVRWKAAAAHPGEPAAAASARAGRTPLFASAAEWQRAAGASG